MNCFLGIDIGTTHAKAVLVGENGSSFYEVKQEYQLLRPNPGYEEQDPVEIMNAVSNIISQSLQVISRQDRVAAVGFSAAMHSIFPVDEEGRPLHNAIIWADTRSKKEAEYIRLNHEAAIIYANTGIPIHPMSPLCKIIWLRKQLPKVFNKTARFISIKEYVFYCLFGKYIVDYSIASATGLFNLSKNKWDELALQVAGIDEKQLSYPVSTTHVEHELKPLYAKMFNLKEAIPFVIGASDGCLANLGSGAMQHGETALTIGTSGAVRMTVRSTPGSLMPGSEQLFTYPLVDDLYVRGGAINNGGIVLTWLSEMFLSGGKGGKDNYELLLKMAEKASPGANGLLFLPYLLGERAPVWDPDARGVLLGLTMKHGKEQIFRAGLEGVCFTLFQLIKKLERINGPINEVYASGGFVQSSFWVQLLANITGKKLIVSKMADASAMGAVYLAMYAIGHLKDLSGAKLFIQPGQLYEPVLSIHKKYDGLFQLFESLYPKLKDDFTELSRLN